MNCSNLGVFTNSENRLVKTALNFCEARETNFLALCKCIMRIPIYVLGSYYEGISSRCRANWGPREYFQKWNKPYLHVAYYWDNPPLPISNKTEFIVAHLGESNCKIHMGSSIETRIVAWYYSGLFFLLHRLFNFGNVVQKTTTTSNWLLV